jgi:L-asparagine transporter-like permease
MFSSPIPAVMMFAVMFSMAFIMLCLYYVNKLFANNTQEILVRFILLVFTSLVAVYIIDKVVAFRIALLSDNQDAQLFDLIKTLILMIFSYYFGTKKEMEKK